MFFQDHDKSTPTSPPTPVKGPEEQDNDKASKIQAERESEDKLSDTKPAKVKEVGSVFQFADHFL